MNGSSDHPLARRLIEPLSLESGGPLNHAHQTLSLPASLPVEHLVSVGPRLQVQSHFQGVCKSQHAREARPRLVARQDSLNRWQRDTAPLGERVKGHSQLLTPSIQRPD